VEKPTPLFDKLTRSALLPNDFLTYQPIASLYSLFDVRADKSNSNQRSRTYHEPAVLHRRLAASPPPHLRRVPSLTGTSEAARRMILRLVGMQVSPLRRRSNTPLVQVSPQGAHTPPKIHLIAGFRNFTNQKLQKRMIPLATLGPAPGGRGHPGSPLSCVPDLTSNFAAGWKSRGFFYASLGQEVSFIRLRRRSSFCHSRRPPMLSARCHDPSNRSFQQAHEPKPAPTNDYFAPLSRLQAAAHSPGPSTQAKNRPTSTLGIGDRKSPCGLGTTESCHLTEGPFNRQFRRPCLHTVSVWGWSGRSQD
jgi:hypothetical protein